jgi:hypothetical protein
MIHLKRPGRSTIIILIIAVITLSLLLLDTSSESPVIATSLHRGDGEIEGDSDRVAGVGARLRLPAQRPHKPVSGSPATEVGVEHSSSGTGNALTASVPLQAVLDAIASDIVSSASAFDVEAARSELGLQLGDITPEGYASELRATFREFFVSDRSSTRHPDLLDTVLAHLSVLPHPSEPIPKEIYTTDLRPRDQLPEQFASWARENHGWKVQFMDDRDIDNWLDEQLPAAGVGVEMKALGGKRGVVRADLFRWVESSVFFPAPARQAVRIPNECVDLCADSADTSFSCFTAGCTPTRTLLVSGRLSPGQSTTTPTRSTRYSPLSLISSPSYLLRHSNTRHRQLPTYPRISPREMNQAIPLVWARTMDPA